MPTEIYEVVAQGARYWFVFLMALIVWRSYRWYRRDRRQRKKRLRLLPDAGYVGEMVVLQGGAELARGAVLPVPCEGTLGYLRSNDLCVPLKGVSKKHLWFRFDEDEGLMVEPFHGQKLEVDGEAFHSRRNPLYMAHGSRLYVGEAELRLRLFAGFEATAQSRVWAEEAEPEENNAQGASAAAMTPEQFAQWQLWMRQQAVQQYAQQEAMRQFLAWQAAQAGMGGAPGAGAFPAAQSPGGDAAADGDAAPYGDAVSDGGEAVAPDEWDGESEEENWEGDEGWAEDESWEKEESWGGVSERNAPSMYAAPQAPSVPASASMFAAPQAPSMPASASMYAAPQAPYAPASAPAPAPAAPQAPGTPRTPAAPGAAPSSPKPEESAAESWPYASYPQSDAEFVSDGYTYPEYVEDGDFDEDMTDAAAPPKSAYVGHDEAELAKRKLWDRYLGGGRRR